jgi:hypothetical protein
MTKPKSQTEASNLDTGSLEIPDKFLIIITGDKGGTGKSTFARGYIDVLNERGADYMAYDSDKRNSQLYRHYHKAGKGISRLNFSLEDGADALIDQMDTGKPPLIVIDLPAGAGEHLENFNHQLGFLREARDMGYAVTIVSVLSCIKDSVNALRLLMDYTEDKVKHIAVRNLYWGDEEKFSLFDESKIKERLLAADGLILNMPKLYQPAYSLIDKHNATFRFASKISENFPRSQSMRVYQWLQLFETELDTANKFLGI